MLSSSEISITISVISIFIKLFIPYCAQAISTLIHYQYGKLLKASKEVKDIRIEKQLKLVKELTQIVREAKESSRSYNKYVSRDHLKFESSGHEPENPIAL